ncbi:MAG TPA: alpha/beta fold hydrolase [Azonexus sp.]|nr:alpha/beta fold hydrolase [Azonexus sp.]
MAPASSATIILIPGLWMPAAVLLPWQWRLQAAGQAVRRFAYPSRQELEGNVDALTRCLADTPGQPIHLVGHSLGGLLILSLLARGRDERPGRLGRVVLLGSPALGSHAAARLEAMAWGTRMLGHSLPAWLAEPLPTLPPGVEIGVIAGTRCLGLGRLLGGLPRPNDGVVAVAETRLPGVADFITLPLSHAGMLLSTASTDQVVHFLAEGRFRHD